jgi:hypothetical protein
MEYTKTKHTIRTYWDHIRAKVGEILHYQMGRLFFLVILQIGFADRQNKEV